MSKPGILDKLRSLLPSVPQNTEELLTTASTAALLTFEIEALEAERDDVVEAAKTPYDARIIGKQKALKGLMSALKSWATAHRDDFGGRKSYVIGGHALSFRQSPGKLTCSDEEKALDAILATGDHELIALCIAVKPALDKTGIKAALEGTDPAVAKRLRDLGFEVAKPEAFKFEPARVA